MSIGLKTWIETTESHTWCDRLKADSDSSRIAGGNPAGLRSADLEPAGTAAAGMGFADDRLVLEPQREQSFEGFGGCFNELGMEALNLLPEARKEAALDCLFDAEEGLGFSLCRLPIGASDYALNWYSLDEEPGDLSLRHFSIQRDRSLLIPYIQAARKRQPDMRFFASPWSPPTWMKNPPVYNCGRLRMEKDILEAYARYLLAYLRAYRAEGIDVSRLHVQNEPFADQKFPSCLWSADQFRVFIRDYLGPLFEAEGEKAEIWLGTLNGPEEMNFGPMGIKLCSFDDYVERILLDQECRRFIAGIGYQWAGRGNLQRTKASWPDIKIMQTENECGDGNNSWDYAFYVFKLIRHYLNNGAISYAYWNMVLQPGGHSSWGWPQNAMITADPGKKDFVLNPEYYVIKHCSRFLPQGSRLIPLTGRWAGTSLAFEAPDGKRILLVANFQDTSRSLCIEEGGSRLFKAQLAARSINSLIFG